MIEDEARTKWCPFVRLTGTEQEWHTNRPPGESAPAEGASYRCIASACMAWRWQRGARVYRLSKPGGEKTYSFPVADAARFETDRDFAVEPETGGYCGLAGGPQ